MMKKTKVAMTETASDLVQRSLAQPELHRQWSHTYRQAENERFFDLAFDSIVDFFHAPRYSTILDAGCGTGEHAIRLAQRGFFVRAIDVSDTALEEARTNIRMNKLEAQIHVQQEDLLSLSFPDETFKYILCWGVLMHIPALETALGELTRVLQPGGVLALG